MSDLNKANRKALHRIITSDPILIDVKTAKKIVPGMKENLILHAGPEISFKEMCPIMKSALIGAAMYEGFATDPRKAEQLLTSGRLEVSSTNNHSCVAPMAGVISPSMPVFVIKNKTFGNLAFSNINEGGAHIKSLRYGSFERSVLRRLKWIEETLGPILRESIRANGGISLRNIISESLKRGDECHSRMRSATQSFAMLIVPRLLHQGRQAKQVFRAISDNPHFFLNLSMAACKASLDSGSGIAPSSILTGMTSNGIDFGIRISGLGNRWFTSLSPRHWRARFFEKKTARFANRALGDSFVSEPAGIGASAIAAAPALSEFLGEKIRFGIELNQKMYRITNGKHGFYTIPALDYAGAPVGYDLREILRKKITPAVNLGLAHRRPGGGQIGAGIAWAPIGCFSKAGKAFYSEFGIDLEKS